MLSDYEQVKNYLYGLRYHGAKYGIERMEFLADLIGHPERDYPLIHVAGTNGKGSTCAMIEAIYRRVGLKTGLFTSPHLVFLGERIQVNRRNLDRQSISEYTRDLRAAVGKRVSLDSDDHPSFFEFITAMALLHLSRQKVDIGIIETGLGGRLDATNIVLPEVAVITSISLDHCEILGDSIEEIAFEKAGIIKGDRPVVLGHLPPEAERLIRERAASKRAPIFSIAERFGQDLDRYPSTNLEGRFQRWNAATATLVCEVLRERFPVSPYDVHAALHSVDWPARWDLRHLGRKRLYLDTTHNPEGAVMLNELVDHLVRDSGGRPIFIVGTLGRFRADALMPVVARHAREIVLLEPAQPRAASFQMLRSAIPPSFRGAVSESTVGELFPFAGHCSVGEDDATIVATGSIYLIGEILDAIDYQSAVLEHLLQ